MLYCQTVLPIDSQAVQLKLPPKKTTEETKHKKKEAGVDNRWTDVLKSNKRYKCVQYKTSNMIKHQQPPGGEAGVSLTDKSELFFSCMQHRTHSHAFQN